jgi:hypothetical protein
MNVINRYTYHTIFYIGFALGIAYIAMTLAIRRWFQASSHTGQRPPSSPKGFALISAILRYRPETPLRAAVVGIWKIIAVLALLIFLAVFAMNFFFPNEIL